MKLIGSLENFQPASLLQWFQTERADGILAVQVHPGYRLRFEHGELVAASHWPPGESLERRLVREAGAERAAEIRRIAESRGVSMAGLLAELMGEDKASSVIRSHAEGVVFRVLEETNGRFFFDPASRPLPDALRTHFQISQVLLEGARLRDEQEQLAEWIPPAHTPLKLVRAPEDCEDSVTGLRGALVENLREVRSRQQLEDAIPAESHTVRLKLAELVRSGNIEVIRDPVAQAAAEARDRSSTARLLQLTKAPTADDWPFLTVSEAGLMEELGRGPESLEEAGQWLREGRRELLPAAEILTDSRAIEVSTSSPGGRWMRSLVLGAALVGALGAFLLLFPSLSRRVTVAPSQELEAVESAPAAAETAPAPDEVAAAETANAEPAGEAVAPDEVAEPESAAAPRPETVSTPPPVSPPPPRQPPPGQPLPRSVPAARDAEIRERFEAQLRAARQALDAGGVVEAEAALARAAALLPGEPSLAELWHEIRLAAAPPPAPPPPPPAAPGRLVINSVPYGFVRIDGQEKGSTPVRLELGPGTYAIEIYRAGYVPITRSVELESDTVFLETFNLELEDDEEDG